MKAYIIQSGHFSQAGNFMGFSAKGEKIHIYKKDIIRLFPQVGIVYRCLGRYEKELVKLPFYCLAEEKTFPYMTHDGQITGQTFTRLTAIEIRDSKYEIKVAAVNNYDYTHPYSSYNNDDLLDEIHNLKIDHEVSYNKMAERCNDLREENKDLIDENKKLKWDLEYSQSERERLELLCKKHEETIKNYQHVVNKIKELTSHDLDNLIALA
jgi:hypothetical protein